jgi:DNA-binding FadR family transcriptional regulator
LKALIGEGHLRPGDRLPSEIDLAAAFGVGRSTVREAKKVLIAKGLIAPHGKTGAFVAMPSESHGALPDLDHLLSDPTLADLHAVRQIVEVAAARAAVLHISAHQVAVMRHTLHEIETESANGSSGAWFRFIELHRQIVEASGNSVLVTIYSLIEHLLNRHQVPFLPSIANWQHELASHGRLIDLLETRDADAVEAEMTHHLALADQLRQDLLQHAHARPAPPRT